MKCFKKILCVVLTLAQITQQAHGLISPSAGGGGGGGFFQKRLKADSIRSSMPIDQLREALINSQAFKELVERLEDRTHGDAAVIDAAQVKLVDPPRNASNDPPVPSAGTGNGNGGPDRVRSIPPVAADTITTSTSAPLGSSADAADLPMQREKKPDATTGSPRDAAGAGSATATRASQSAAPKPPPFNLFGRGRDGKKNSSPKPAADKGVGEKGKAEAEAAARAEELLQVLRRQMEIEQNLGFCGCLVSRVSMKADDAVRTPPVGSLLPGGTAVFVCRVACLCTSPKFSSRFIQNMAHAVCRLLYGCIMCHVESNGFMFQVLGVLERSRELSKLGEQNLEQTLDKEGSHESESA